MKYQSKNRSGLFPRCLLALAVSAALGTMASGVWAQEVDEDADEDATEEESLELGRVEVTGSLIKREDFVSTSPMQIINAESQARAGQLTIAEVLQETTVAGGTTQLNNQFNGFVIQGGSGVQTLDLRGLGTTRTLVLLNSRRPGGSGTRGQVQAVDLSTIPDLAVQRVEVVLDGSSSIYGSDAVAGVANLITRRSVDRTELSVTSEVPGDSGGEFYRAGLITGLNSDKGSMMFSAQYEVQEPLRVEDRDFLSCGDDLAYDASGNRIDREDRSITQDTALGGCNNLYANTVIGPGGRYIPAPDGVTIGPYPGYRPRVNPTYADGQAYYEDVLNFDFAGRRMAINRLERLNVYATADYALDFLGGVDWDAEFLYSNRKSELESWRQFFPPIFTPVSDDLVPEGSIIQPVMPYPSNGDVDVDFYYFSTGLEGLLPTDNYWSWQAYASYSYSDGDYTRNSILSSQSGDVRFDPDPPLINYTDPAILSGQDMQRLIDAVGVTHTGNTVYDQFQVTAIVSGELFQLPAGFLSTAFGLEYRNFSIDDVPSAPTLAGDLWGESSAVVTKGSNDVVEAFAEAEIPILAGMTGFESLTLNLSARAFDYKEGGSDWVWKTGLNWQIAPTFRVRSTAGTSYRAPALFELYLGDQTSFANQLGLDPCIDWGESTNELIRRNCQADGIPMDHGTAGSSSATVISGGGVGNLDPETSDAFTFGFVVTPEFSDLSIAVDYFDQEVNDQISQLGGSQILSGCYGSENFPNAFCDLFTRNPASAPDFPLQIATVRDTFVNINSQRVTGVDLNLRWDHGFDFGRFQLEAQSTWYRENTFQLFDPSLVAGFDQTDVVGTIGSPDHLTNVRASVERNDWTFTYFLQHVAETDQSDFADEEFTYFGFENARRDITMDAVFYHSISVFYERDNWDFLVGINNLLDEEPDVISSGVTGTSGLSMARRGNVPIASTQYDLIGRRAFARLNFRF